MLYLQHPKDAIDFFKFEEEYGRTHVLPSSIFFRRGGFDIGEKSAFRDYNGKEHLVEISPSPVNDTGENSVYLTVDHHPIVLTTFLPNQQSKATGSTAILSKEEKLDLAKAGERSHIGLFSFIGAVSPAGASLLLPFGKLILIHKNDSSTIVTKIESHFADKVNGTPGKFKRVDKITEHLLSLWRKFRYFFRMNKDIALPCMVSENKCRRAHCRLCGIHSINIQVEIAVLLPHGNRCSLSHHTSSWWR